LNVTVPVGVPAPGATALAVAVSVTAWPNTEEEAALVNARDVDDWLTTTDCAAEELA
jgi:hypothetical protein